MIIQRALPWLVTVAIRESFWPVPPAAHIGEDPRSLVTLAAELFADAAYLQLDTPTPVQ